MSNTETPITVVPLRDVEAAELQRGDSKDIESLHEEAAGIGKTFARDEAIEGETFEHSLSNRQAFRFYKMVGQNRPVCSASLTLFLVCLLGAHCVALDHNGRIRYVCDWHISSFTRLSRVLWKVLSQDQPVSDPSAMAIRTRTRWKSWQLYRNRECASTSAFATRYEYDDLIRFCSRWVVSSLSALGIVNP